MVLTRVSVDFSGVNYCAGPVSQVLKFFSRNLRDGEGGRGKGSPPEYSTLHKALQKQNDHGTMPR